MTTDIAPARGPRPGTPVPPLELPLVGGGMFWLADAAPRLFTMLVFNRGLHCLVCRAQLSELNRRFDELLDHAVAASPHAPTRAGWRSDEPPHANPVPEIS